MVEKQKMFDLIPKGIGIGLTASLVCTILGAAIGAWLLTTETIGEGNLGYITMLVILFSSVVAALVSFKVIKKKRLPVCIIAGGTYFLSLLSINALFYRGMYSGVGECALLVLAGALSVAILGLNSHNKMKRKKYK